MWNNFKMEFGRNKKTWARFSNRRSLRQVDYCLYFDIQPGNIEGWYSMPRQIYAIKGMENATEVIDYGPDIEMGRIHLEHPLLHQKDIDSLEMMAYSKPSQDWWLWNHRRDRRAVRLDDGWRATSTRTLFQDYEHETDDAIAFDPLTSTCVFDWSGDQMWVARSNGTNVYLGALGGAMTMMGLGTNPSLSHADNGLKYLAYERGGQLFIRWEIIQGAWSAELAVLRNDPETRPGVALYDPAATYHHPWVINASGRMWLFYIKTKNGESEIEYRIERQEWYDAHHVPTMLGYKTSVRVAQLTAHPVYKKGLLVAWVNWDQADEGSSVLVPNVYFIHSTPPEKQYGLTEFQSKDQYITKINEYEPVSTITAPTDELTFELVGG